jgi:hypothetical protein
MLKFTIRQQSPKHTKYTDMINTKESTFFLHIAIQRIDFDISKDITTVLAEEILLH